MGKKLLALIKQKKLLALALLAGAGLGLLLIPTTVTVAQQFGGKGKGKGGGFNQGGGPGGGGPGGKMGGMMSDPDKVFDWMSRGQGFIVISNMKGGMRDPMQEWANANGVTSGQLTREQFAHFAQWFQEKIASGQVPGLPGGGKGGQQGNMDPDAMAAQRFKDADANGDGYLTEDEMSNRMKTMQPNGQPLWKKYDKNNDGKLDLEEYKAYFRDAIAQRGNNNNQVGGADEVIMEEDWEKRPVVFRAGKLPKELPAWFAQLDTDNDGQVGYYEWRKSGKSFEEFSAMDRNGDGLLTAEEVLWYLKINVPKDGSGDAVAQGPSAGYNGPGFNWNPGAFNQGFNNRPGPGFNNPNWPGPGMGNGPPRKGPGGPGPGGPGGPGPGGPGKGKGKGGFGGKGNGGFGG
jgi:Ca2+-binding EF-hand superfamily protein